MKRAPKNSCETNVSASPSSVVGRGWERNGDRAGNLRIMVVNEPCSYREAIAAALKVLRPGMEIFAADPENIDGEFLRLVPHLVVCSRLTELISQEAPAWIELYPGGSSYAVANLDGATTTYHDVDLDTLVSVLDGARRLHEPA